MSEMQEWVDSHLGEYAGTVHIDTTRALPEAGPFAIIVEAANYSGAVITVKMSGAGDELVIVTSTFSAGEHKSGSVFDGGNGDVLVSVPLYE